MIIRFETKMKDIEKNEKELIDRVEELEKEYSKLFEKYQHVRKTITEYEQRLGLVENSNDCIMRFDREFRHLYVNSIVQEQTGIPPEEFIGKTHTELGFPEHLVNVWEDAVRCVFNSGKEHRIEFQLPSGIWIDWLLIPEYSVNGEVSSVLTSARDITDRKNVEINLEYERNLLSTFMESVPDHIYFKDILGRFTRVNKAQTTWLHANSQEDIVGKTDYDFFSQKHADEAKLDEELVMKNKQPITAKEEMETWPDGTTTWVTTTKMPLLDGEGEVIGTFGVSRDITEKNKADQALAESEERHRRLTENAQDIIWQTNIDGEVLFINSAVEKTLGYRVEQAVGMPGKDYLAEKSLYKLQEWIDQSVHSNPPENYFHGELDYLNINGQIVHCEANVTMIRNEEGRIVAIEGVSRDISVRKMAERALKQSEERYRALVESIHDIIHKTDINGNFTFINPGSERIIGYTAEELIGSHYLNLVRSDYREGISEFFNRQFSERILNTYFEFPILNRWGNELWIGQNSQLVIEDDKIIGFQAVARDITERRSAEIALQRVNDELERRVDERTAELSESNRLLVQEINERRRTQAKLQTSLSKYRKAMEGVINAMALTVEMRDPYTAGHQQRVTELAVAIAEEMGLPDDRIDGIRMAGIIHDLGKISVPAEILSKPGKLTEIVFDMIKIHPHVGYEILKPIDFPWPVADIVLQHHERMDGSGYPNGLARDRIILEARILSVADVFEAVSSHRPYRPALGMEAALDEIIQNRGTLYDATVVDACEAVIRRKDFKFDIEQKKIINGDR